MTFHIFVIGFNKTGTRTLHNFFYKNDIMSIHYDRNRIVDTFEKNIRENKKLLENGIYYDKVTKKIIHMTILLFFQI